MWVYITPEFMRKKFSLGFCGSYGEDHGHFSPKDWALMYTPESSMVINQLKEVEKGLTENNDCWNQYFGDIDGPEDIKYMAQDERIFYHIVRLLSKSVLAEMDQHRKADFWDKNFGNSFLFDGIVSLL